MSQKNKKQFGIWMDNHHATVIGRTNAESFSVIGLGFLGTMTVGAPVSLAIERKSTSEYSGFM